MVSNIVTFMSQNMTGIDSVKTQYLREILNEFDVNYCTLQEHFKTTISTDQWFKKQFKDYHTYVTSAYRLPGVDTGRGRGGLAQLSLRNIAVSRSRIVTRSPRLQAQMLTFPT